MAKIDITMSQSVNLQQILLALGDRADQVKVKIMNAGRVRISDHQVEFFESPSCVSLKAGELRKQLVEGNRKLRASEQIRTHRKKHRKLLPEGFIK